jgi:hypothetical protein
MTWLRPVDRTSGTLTLNAGTLSCLVHHGTLLSERCPTTTALERTTVPMDDADRMPPLEAVKPRKILFDAIHRGRGSKPGPAFCRRARIELPRAISAAGSGARVRKYMRRAAPGISSLPRPDTLLRVECTYPLASTSSSLSKGWGCTRRIRPANSVLRSPTDHEQDQRPGECVRTGQLSHANGVTCCR